MHIFLKPITLLTIITAHATILFADTVPDRVYLNIATRHFGMGEEIFGINGPNEFNPGIGLGWDIENSNLRTNAAIYRDSFGHPSITMGASIPFMSEQNWSLVMGISTTKSLAGDQKFAFKNGMRTVKSRFYAWPYLQFEYRHFYTQLRAGINRNREFAGVFAFGITIALEEFYRQSR